MSEHHSIKSQIPSKPKILELAEKIPEPRSESSPQQAAGEYDPKRFNPVYPFSVDRKGSLSCFEIVAKIFSEMQSSLC